MSIPTSLIFVVLVAAWLTVLVPMVARRRETVPELEADSGTFRVLRRASASMRRRPGFGRRDQLDDAVNDESPDTEELPTDEALDEELLDNEDEKICDDSGSDEERFVEGEGSGDRPDARGEGHDYEYAQPAPEQFQDRIPRGRRDQADLTYPTGGVDEAQLRPVPRRHGRGGYDPDAAELAKAYRYSRRRRVSVILLLATVAFSVAAVLVNPTLWSGTVVSGLLLVAYLGYLRRQVHIENDIQQRRLDRLRRARQIRPEYHSDRQDAPVDGGGFARRDQLVSQVPPSGYRRGREIVDLEDDDPSFDDLDYYQPIAYRRASGQ